MHVPANIAFFADRCRAHDADEDESLDGLELLKAVLHAHEDHEGKKAGYADEQRGADAADASTVSEETFGEVEGNHFT